jgi:glycosyltransferase involved in cell wall biosynthesis
MRLDESTPAHADGPIRILLVPNVSWWVIGAMARQIAANLGPRFACYIVPETVFARCPRLRNSLLRNVHLLHVMDEGTLEALDDLAMPHCPPMITWIHHVTSWSRWHEAAIRKSQALVTCTPQWASVVREHAGERMPVAVVPHAVDTTFFRRTPAAREAFGIPPGKFAVGFAASRASDNDNQRKGLSTLTQVLLLGSKAIPDLHIVFAGLGWEDEVQSLRARGISASYTGYLKSSSLPQFYSSLDAYLVTSRIEGGPLTVLESMACGTPVVATRVGLVPEVIEDNCTGFSAAVDDEAALVGGLTRLYEKPELRAELGRNARLLMEQSRNWKAALSSLAECYSDLAGNSPKREPLPQRYAFKPRILSNAACAADCLIATYRQMGKSTSSHWEALKHLPTMLSGLRANDVLRGLLLLAAK